MRLHGITIADDGIAAICRKYGASRLSLFGSVLRDDFGPESDIDMLAEFPESAAISLFDLGAMLSDLQALIGRRIDLKTSGFLSPYFRDQVVREAKPIYDAQRTERAA